MTSQELAGLSVLIGVDLTVDRDLLRQLQFVVDGANRCKEDVKAFVDAVHAYETTVIGHQPLPMVPLE